MKKLRTPAAIKPIQLCSIRFTAGLLIETRSQCQWEKSMAPNSNKSRGLFYYAVNKALGPVSRRESVAPMRRQVFGVFASHNLKAFFEPLFRRPWVVFAGRWKLEARH